MLHVELTKSLNRDQEAPLSSAELVSALKQCSRIRDLELGQELHVHALQTNRHTNKYVASALINMYSKCKRMADAWEVFNSLKDPNVYAWTCLMMGCVENGESFAAVDLFFKMDCEPSSATFVAALKACSKLAAEVQSELTMEDYLRKGIALHATASVRGLDSNLVVANTLIDMYGKLGDMRRAQNVCERMPMRDVVSWNALILGYVANGENVFALKYFTVMDCEPDYLTFVAALKACGSLAAGSESGEFWLRKLMAIHEQVKHRGLESRLVVSNTLVDVYGKLGCMSSARTVFNRMSERDVVSWNCLIIGYVENGESSAALEVLSSMDCQPDSVTYIGALKACASLAGDRSSEKESCLRRGMEIHEQLCRRGLELETVLGNVLLDMYCKCGSLGSACGVFESMANRTVVSWTCLMLGYVENGGSSLAVELFKRMSCEPNSFTYVAVLKACGSQAALELGEQIHSQVCRRGMEERQLVANGLVDLYGKCGKVSVAEQVFCGMHTPTRASWNALIAGYSSRGEPERVFSLTRQMVEAGVQMDDITLVCVLAVCSRAGIWKEVPGAHNRSRMEPEERDLRIVRA